MQSLLSKIQLLGFNILDNNSFAVIYEDGNKKKYLAKLNEDGTITRADSFDTYSTCEHFINIGKEDFRLVTGLYCKKSNKNLLGKAQDVSIKFINKNNYTVESNLIMDNVSSLILVETKSTTHLINSNGIKRSFPILKSYREIYTQDGLFDVGIQAIDCKTYIIGSGRTCRRWHTYEEGKKKRIRRTTKMYEYNIEHIDNILMEVDNNIKIVKSVLFKGE